MKYFFDFEFNENVHPIEPISLGMVAENGKEFYAIYKGYAQHAEYLQALKGENNYYPQDFLYLHSCNDWVKKNVLPIMDIAPDEAVDHVIGDEETIKNSLQAFVGLDPAPEFWGYYADYDWFLLTRMFKSFDRMPSKWPQVCYDLHQYARHVGCHRELPHKLMPAHNALVDARWTKMAFDRVKEIRNLRLPVNKEPVWP